MGDEGSPPRDYAAAATAVSWPQRCHGQRGVCGQRCDSGWLFDLELTAPPRPGCAVVARHHGGDRLPPIQRHPRVELPDCPEPVRFPADRLLGAQRVVVSMLLPETATPPTTPPTENSSYITFLYIYIFRTFFEHFCTFTF